MDDENKSKEQLIRELAEARAQLAALQNGSDAYQRNSVLEGINKIFQMATNCQTEEELGKLCLKVAEEVTSSQFGFIGEINQRTNKLDNIVISDAGWKACRMEEQSGHGRIVPMELNIHRIYGRIMRDGKGFFTNTPDTHPDSVGLPAGHPPLKSFLGVPLTYAERTIGIVCVANRSDGYQEADLEVLEALAPAIVQSLVNKRSEQKLRERILTYRSMFDHNHAVILMIDPTDGKIVNANTAASTFYGYSIDEITKLKISDINTLPIERIHQELQSAKSAPGRHFFFKHRLANGEIRDVEVFGGPIFFRGRELLYSIVHDITGRKRAEESLRDSEEKKRLALEAGQLGTWEFIPKTQELFFDKRSREIFRISPSGPLNLQNIIELIHPQDRKYFQEDIQDMLNSPERTKVNLEYRILSANGEQHWISVTGKVFTSDGPEHEVVRIVGTHMDITDRKGAEEALRKSEHRYRSLFQAMEAFAFMEPIFDPEGRIIDFRYLEVNDAGANIRGVTPDIIQGKTILELLPKIDPFWIEAYSTVVTTGEPLQFERQNRRNGRWYRTYAFCPEKGKVASLLIDITGRKKAEQSLQELTEKLEQRVVERTALAESRSRQLQRLAVELSEAEERERQRIANLLHEDLQQFLAAARFTLQSKYHRDSETKEAERLLESAISKSRYLSHELSPPVLHHSDIMGAIEWLGLHMRNQFGLNVQLEIQTAEKVDSAPLRVFLFRAVQELLFNVVKHAEVETAHVNVFESANEIVAIVSDHGKGFDPSILETYSPNAGLGLRSLQERSNFLGGSLTISSAPGQGSRFILRVPAEVGTNIQYNLLTSSEQERNQIAGSAGSIGDGNGIRILFADDHKVMRQGLIRLVSGKPNVSVVGEAANGKEALDLARRLKPNVVVMDVSMPVMDGIEATRMIRAELPDVHVLGLSMYEDEHVSNAMKSAGAEAFLSKATSSSELLNTIYQIAGSVQEGPSTGKEPTKMELPL